MSTEFEGPPAGALETAPGGGLKPENELPLTLGRLQVGSRIVLQCRKDWRNATIIAIGHEHVTLAVGSPTGHTYRVRRPSETAIVFDGNVPVLGKGAWRIALARYDLRW